MFYVDFVTSQNTYKLRLATKNVVELEKKLGCNPLSIFGEGKETKVPTIGTMVNILHASLQALEHGITLDKTYEIFDGWLAEGNTAVNFVKVILEIYKVSGLVPNDTPAVGDEKNE